MFTFSTAFGSEHAQEPTNPVGSPSCGKAIPPCTLGYKISTKKPEIT